MTLVFNLICILFLENYKCPEDLTHNFQASHSSCTAQFIPFWLSFNIFINVYSILSKKIIAIKNVPIWESSFMISVNLNGIIDVFCLLFYKGFWNFFSRIFQNVLQQTFEHFLRYDLFLNFIESLKKKNHSETASKHWVDLAVFC